MTDSKVYLTRADAYLLAAATESSRPQKLSDFINSYDWLNRSIPSYYEASSGFARLVARGYIKVRKGRSSGIRVQTTPDGAELGKKARIGARSLGDVVVGMSRVLGCKPYPEPEVEDRSLGRLKGMTLEEWDAAVAANAASMEKYIGAAKVVGRVVGHIVRNAGPGPLAADHTSLGPVGFRISATDSGGLDWNRLEATWAQAGDQDVFSAGWLSDHLSDASRDRGGVAFEAFTTAAALAHHVPGKWIGLAVAANTFRHPAVLAKQATMLDIVTRGRFILGLGAGWHVGEHEAFGIDLPEPRERFDRYESALRVVSALFSEQARLPPGVTLDDPIYPLDRATNQPPPTTPSGPPIWLGGQRRRGMELIARYASGWPLPGNRAGDIGYFSEKRDQIRRALEAAGRDPDDFTFAAQVDCGGDATTRRAALDVARQMQRAGADHVILGIPGSAAPYTLVAMASEVAQPLRESAEAAKA